MPIVVAIGSVWNLTRILLLEIFTFKKKRKKIRKTLFGIVVVVWSGWCRYSGQTILTLGFFSKFFFFIFPRLIQYTHMKIMLFIYMAQEKPGYMSETAILKKLQCFYPSTFHCVFEKIARNIGKKTWLINQLLVSCMTTSMYLSTEKIVCLFPLDIVL